MERKDENAQRAISNNLEAIQEMDVEGWSPKTGYDLAAEFYDNWKWQLIWQKLEWPIIEKLATTGDLSASLLDVGVGTGTYALRLSQMFPRLQIHGIDISGKMLSRAKAKLGNRAKLEIGDAQDMPIEGSCIDIVLMTRVGSHLQSLEKAAQELARVLKPGGVLVLSDLHPNFNYTRTRLPTKLGKIEVATHKHSDTQWISSLQQYGVHLVDRVEIGKTDVLSSGLPLPSSILGFHSDCVAFVLKFEKHIRSD